MTEFVPFIKVNPNLGGQWNKNVRLNDKIQIYMFPYVKFVYILGFDLCMHHNGYYYWSLFIAQVFLTGYYNWLSSLTLSVIVVHPFHLT